MSSDSQKHTPRGETEVGGEERKYYEPSRIWYAGTEFPLFSACFVPLGLALSIAAPIENLRLSIPSSRMGADEVFIQDPSW